MDFPRTLLVRQNLPDRSIRDIPGEVRRQLADAAFAGQLKRGASVAIGVGSRGIANIATIVRSVVDYWKSEGMDPFIFPAMGSHGAATAEGQAEVLAHYGIEASSMGCPIRSALAVTPAGRTPEGVEAFVDRLAYESDGIMLVSRVKWHTGFAGKIESGLLKMMAIGLGKRVGAQRYHSHSFHLGLENVIRSVARQILNTGKILGGLAILEDANHGTAQLTAVGMEEMEQREEELLALVKSWKAHIPVPEIDILVVDEMGKNISGTGMDTKIVNRGTGGEYNPWPDAPVIKRIFVRAISDLSYGNGVGVGMADVVTDRLVESIDWEPTQVNALTASSPALIRTPIHFPTDRECLEKFAPTVGNLDSKDIKLGRIRNTMKLNLLVLSENLLPEIEKNPALEVVGPPRELEYDAEGNLVGLLRPGDEW